MWCDVEVEADGSQDPDVRTSKVGAGLRSIACTDAVPTSGPGR